MPLYEYACRQCGHRFEVRQGIRDEPLATCPQCTGPIRRVVQPVGIVFKGSGFYKTDSRGSSASTVPAGERADGSAPSGTTETSAAPATSGATPSPAPNASSSSATS